MDGWGDSGQLNRCENERLDAGWVADRWVDPASVLLAVDDSGRISVNPTGTGLSERNPSGSFESQRHFLLATGMTRQAYQQIQRARYAAGLLRAGMGVVEAVHRAGYFDQAHLTRSLGRLIGETPGRIRRGDQQLSFLYKTALPD